MDRSQVMSRVRGANTTPELKVRRFLFANGFRYRLHKSTLPGKPDLVLTKYKAVIFVHGCFWHWHGCKRSRMPNTNVEYWEKKIGRNIVNDKKNVQELIFLGWRVLIIWECSLQNSRLLETTGRAIKWLMNSENKLESIE